jgi:hypothetical protein
MLFPESITTPGRPGAMNNLICISAHALLFVEERLAEQEAEGVEMPEGMERDELALRILVAVHHLRRPGLWSQSKPIGLQGSPLPCRTGAEEG